MSKLPPSVLGSFGAFYDWLMGHEGSYCRTAADDMVWEVVVRIVQGERRKGRSFSPSMVFVMEPEQLMVYYLMIKMEQEEA